MSKLRILYVASEVAPFLSTTQVADFIRKLPSAMQDKGFDIRILVPRFGLINERKNRLHEVVRLSGFTVPVGDSDMPVTIKVASLPLARLQVYFIDNEDYFQRKYVFTDKESKFYEDNDERAIFFCKGALETVKKLGWSPDIVHCSDWMTALIPLYLKTTYKNDPIFKDSKSVFSVFDNGFSHKFPFEGFYEKVKMTHVDDEMLGSLSSADYDGFVKIGIEYSDIVITTEEEITEKFNTIFNELPDKKFEYVSETNIDGFYDLYTELAGE
ncbi:MAG: glycogen/starch synthase [Arcicella sp.]|jgi:starch synthase|nr:glycogen/starch synthase [Arcicella sp.]